MPRPTEGWPLLEHRKKPIVLLALVALLVAQTAAWTHLLEHFGKQGDPLGLPGHHAQLCLECASFASLNTMHGGTVTALTVTVPDTLALVCAVVTAPAGRTLYLPFRSRAPPR